MLTTMTRLVENQRLQIGTLMALGYNRFVLTVHYVSYGLWSGLIGGILGLSLGGKVFALVLIPLFESIYILPRWSTPLTIGGILSVAVMLFCCVSAVIVSIRGSLKDLPAVTLRGTGKIMNTRRFSKDSKLWGKLSIESKSTLRNIRHNKVRSVMGIIGVLGCMMLILAALGLRNSLHHTLDLLVSGDYEYKVQIKEDANLESFLKLSSNAQAIQEGVLQISANGKDETVFFTAFDRGFLGEPVDSDGKRLQLAESGLVVSQRLASIFGLKLGEIVNIRLPLEEIKTVEIVEVGNYPVPKSVYLSKKALEEVGYTFKPNAVLYSKIDPTLFSKMDGVQEVITKSKQKESIEELLKSANVIVTVLILGAMVLGVTVIYNLGLLNYTEMSREYATLKVLGLYPREIRLMAFREHFILMVTGYVLGIPAGYWFLQVYMFTLSSGSQIFFANLKFTSFLLATLITLSCAFGVNLILGRKIDDIDMVTSLKGVE